MAKKNSRHAASLMPRTKAVRKSARPSASKSIDFPIDKLPAELIHMICAYLRPTEIANLRLVSRLVAPIGLQYMVPEVHLILAKDSFEQLKALAEHPIVSKCVTSFFFEADKFGVLPREHWEQLVFGPEYVAQLEEMGKRGHPCQHASERTLRTYRREMSKLSATPRHRYSQERIEDAFEKYSDFSHFQQDPQQRAMQEKEVVDAMKHFPHVKGITMTTQTCARHWTTLMRKTFEPALCTYYETDDRRETTSEPLGLQQMRSLLLGAYHAGLKVETLQCGVVSWRILEQDAETFAHMRESASNVKNLKLEFSTGSLEYDDLWTELEIESCAAYLQSGRLKDFVTAAPNLEHLQIGFLFNDPTWPAYLKYVVGDHHWPSLRTVKFEMIASSEDDLVSFCTRHASTLKSLRLTSFGLIEGDWFSAFNRMRKVLTLDNMEVSGRLEGLNESLDFQPDSPEFYPELQEGIEAYFLVPCSDDDEMGLEDFLDDYSPSTDDTWSELDTDDDVW